METATAIIDALGGDAKLAADLGFQYRSRVANWRHNGIPRSVWPEVLDLAQARGIDLSWETLRAIEASAA